MFSAPRAASVASPWPQGSNARRTTTARSRYSPTPAPPSAPCCTPSVRQPELGVVGASLGMPRRLIRAAGDRERLASRPRRALPEKHPRGPHYLTARPGEEQRRPTESQTLSKRRIALHASDEGFKGRAAGTPAVDARILAVAGGGPALKQGEDGCEKEQTAPDPSPTGQTTKRSGMEKSFKGTWRTWIVMARPPDCIHIG